MSISATMFVVKRDGRREPVQFDKIAQRYGALCKEQNLEQVNSVKLAQEVIRGVYDGVTTQELDELAAETAAAKVLQHIQYSQLAAAIEVSNLHKKTESVYSTLVEAMAAYCHPITKHNAPLVSKELLQVVRTHRDIINSAIDYTRDYQFDYLGIRTLERSYLLKMNDNIVERPQHMFMRVAIGIHGNQIEQILECYHELSQGYYIHATPTLFNAGTPNPQMSSCFLTTIESDSVDGIYNTLKDCAKISKFAGGIGISVLKIRASKSYIAGTNGVSNGLVPMLKVYNETARYIDQGGNKRKGSFAVYLEPWHADIEDFLDLKKTHGKEEMRARDLFYALWIPDLFMRRVEMDGNWSLFCPKEAPGLADVHSKEFETLYKNYEQIAGLARKTMKARDLWTLIKRVKRETGVPYFMFKDHCNNLSNQQNLGTIRSSNLCCEIVEYTSPDEIAVCNLASLNLAKYIVQEDDGSLHYNFNQLIQYTRKLVLNINQVIDRNFYPLDAARRSNMRHRPMAIGVQGLADTFAILKYPYESIQAQTLNRQIFETIYYAACMESTTQAEKHGAYSTFEGSPMSQGKFQFDLHGVEPSQGEFNAYCPAFDWSGLRTLIQQHGIRNSLLVAPMPTASTAQIIGNNECFEPFTSNAYVRRVLAGDIIVLNKHMVRDLTKLGLWNDEVRNHLQLHNGSIQGLDQIPRFIRDLYKTVWEISQKTVLDQSIARGPFICQSQSLNIHMSTPTLAQIDAMTFYAWRNKCKTGCYYLRTRPRVDPVKITADRSAPVSSQQSEPMSLPEMPIEEEDCTS